MPQPDPQELVMGDNLSGRFYSEEELERIAEHREANSAQDEFSVILL